MWLISYRIRIFIGVPTGNFPIWGQICYVPICQFVKVSSIFKLDRVSGPPNCNSHTWSGWLHRLFDWHFESGYLLCHRRSGGWIRYNKGRLKVSFQTTLMLTSDEVVKDQTFQMTSKKDYSKSIIGNSRISFVVNSPIFFSVKDNFLFFTNLSSWNAYS